MKNFVVFCCCISITHAITSISRITQYHLQDSSGQYSYGHSGGPSSQYYSQDSLGQYSYGHSGGPSAKEEVRTADGITQGSYSYIDANNIIQTVSYVSDPVNGFRVAATNLPQASLAAASVALPSAIPVSVPVAVRTDVNTPIVVNYPAVPQETPEVMAARAAHLQAHAAARFGLIRKSRAIADFPVF